MCQFCNQRINPTEDIIAYKIIQDKRSPRAIFGKYFFKLNQVNIAKYYNNFVTDINFEDVILDEGTYRLSVGFFHCIASLNDVKELYENWRRLSRPIHIIKVKIPAKDNIIYEGHTNIGMNSFAATQIIPLEYVPDPQPKSRTRRRFNRL